MSKTPTQYIFPDGTKETISPAMTQEIIRLNNENHKARKETWGEVLWLRQKLGRADETAKWVTSEMNRLRRRASSLRRKLKDARSKRLKTLAVKRITL